MYESFFRFTSRPFVAAPVVTNYYASESSEAARQTLARLIDRAEGPGLIVGPTGVGKTLLCRTLAARFQQTFQVAMLSSTRILTRKALLQNILFELKLPYRNLEEGELRLSLLDHLQPSESCPNGILLIIDEAHSLPLRLLEEIRMITNLVRDGQPRVRLVMAGGAKLEEKFASPKLESFNQRIAARCYLEPFGRDDTTEYVLSRLEAAGGQAASIFDEGALRAIYQATSGIPRLINQVCDHALVMAFAGGQRRIDAIGVEEAWADLQQLPGPWHEAAAPEPAVSTIEFGELDAGLEVADDDDQTFEAAPDGAITEPVATLDLPAEAPAVEAECEVTVGDPFGDGFDEEVVVIDQAVIRSAEIFANRTQVVSCEGRELVESMLPEAENTDEWDSEAEPDATAEISSREHEPSGIGREVADEEPVSTPVAIPLADHERSAASQEDWLSQATFGAQMFEYTAFEPNATADLALQSLCAVNVAIGDLDGEFDASDEPTVKLPDHGDDATGDEEIDRVANDDRSIILVDNDEPTHASATPEGSVHRVEYQTLFSQLRHG